MEYDKIATPMPSTPENLLEATKELVKAFPKYDYVSAGFPGYVKNGVIKTAPNLGNDAWKDFDLAAGLGKALGAPVKWTSTRMEGFVADAHGRNNIIDGTLALDADGKFLAMRMDWINDMGAYLSTGAMGHIRNTTACMTGVYKIPALYARYRIPITNTTPMGA